MEKIDLRAVTGCFTGHRGLGEIERTRLAPLLDEILTALVARGVVNFGSGMAMGFDLLAAEAVLRLRERNQPVKLIAVLPCRDQDAKWPEAERVAYRQILAQADKVTCLSERYYDGCYRARNEWLVANSGVCVAYMKRERSGTGQTVRMAKAAGLEVINLAKTENERHE